MKQYDIPISVVLPVYNGAKTIREAVASILGQTFEDFEFIIINDGSTDDTGNILATFTDPRIRILNQENRGLVASLNRGIMASRGKYVARMDADDQALPERFTKQLDFLERNPSVGAVGTAIKVIYRDGKTAVRRLPKDTVSIMRNIVRVCPLQHCTAMIRKDVMMQVGLYDAGKDGSKCLLVEDYDLWVRILKAGYDMANIMEPLMIVFKGSESIMRSRSWWKRVNQQIFSRIDIIRDLNLGYAAWLNIIPVIIMSFITHYGIKLDRIYNLLSKNGG